MRTIIREWYNVSKAQDNLFRIVPIGDVHIGSVACDEALLQQVVARIAAEEQCYWVGMGDAIDAINIRDRRFDPLTLADWLRVEMLGDLVGAQVARFLELVKPIAHKCLGLIQGNHEYTIQQKFERNAYAEIVHGIQQAGGFGVDHKLALEFQGWLLLKFYWTDRKIGGQKQVAGSLHHGFVNGRLKGAKGLNMERWLWTHACDFAVFGHSHNMDVFTASVEYLDRNGKLRQQLRRGGYSGTFHRSVNPDGPSLYSERKGYFPLPLGGIQIDIRPGMPEQRDRVRMTV